MSLETPLFVFVQSELHADAGELFDQYLAVARPLMAEYGVELVASGAGVATGRTNSIWPRNSLLRYPSVEAMQRFLNDPRYQAVAAQYRDRAYKATYNAAFAPPGPDARAVATAAFAHFAHGLKHGEWDAFCAMLADDITIWFPKGKFKGENKGIERAREFFALVGSVIRVDVLLDKVAVAGNTIFFEFRDEGTLRGQPYHNRVCVAFDVRGDKICGYREYFGLDAT